MCIILVSVNKKEIISLNGNAVLRAKAKRLEE